MACEQPAEPLTEISSRTSIGLKNENGRCLKESGLIICNCVTINRRHKITGKTLLPSLMGSALNSSTQLGTGT